MSLIDAREIDNIDSGPVILFSNVDTWIPKFNDTTRTSLKRMAAPPPPPRQSSSLRPNVAPPPPPPGPASLPPVPPTRNSSMYSNTVPTNNGNKLSTAKSQAKVGSTGSFASQFEALFEPVSHLPKPELFTGCQKLYPSQQSNPIQRSRRSRPAPQPPTNTDESKSSSANQAVSNLIDLTDGEKNLTSFVDESLSKLSSCLTLSNHPSMVDSCAQMTSSNVPCIDCPTCNQIGQSSMSDCHQYPTSCVTVSDQLSSENYQLQQQQQGQPLDTMTNQLSSTTNYLPDSSFNSGITGVPYNYQYNSNRGPYSFSGTPSYNQPAPSGVPSVFGQHNYLSQQQHQSSVNYNEYFWGPN